MQKSDLKIYILFSILFFLSVVMLLPKGGFEYDIWCFQFWTGHLFRHGLINAYKAGGLNYNPGFIYFMYVFQLIQGSEEAIIKNIHFLKVIPLLFDFLGAFICLYIIPKENRYRLVLPFALLFNFCYLYNTTVWGQIDSIHTFFVAASLIFAVKKQPAIAMLLFIIAVNTKLQSIVFLPVIILAIINNPGQFSAKKALLSVFALAVFQYLVLLPFILGNDLPAIIKINLNSVDTYPFISLNAFNFWHLIENGRLHQLSDKLPLASLTYKKWGTILFLFSSFIILLPIALSTLFNLIKSKTNERHSFNNAGVFLTAGLIAIVFFYFNTQMHERYVHPAILLLAIYAFISGNYLFYIVTSVAYFLNLEKTMHYLNIHNYNTVIFSPALVSFLFLFVLIAGIIQLYRTSNLTNLLRAVFSRPNIQT